MSKITIDRAILDQVLEALEGLRKYGVKQSIALLALREALKTNSADVSAMAQPQQEPVANPDQHQAFAFRECEDSHAGKPVPPTIAGVSPQLFAQQIAAAMRYADAPLSHDQFVTLVLYLKARFDDGADNPATNLGE